MHGLYTSAYMSLYVDISGIPVGDGSHKHVTLYNHSLPGPPIVVHEGQQVCINMGKIYGKH